MKISFSTLGCPEWSVAQAVERAEATGFDGIELRFIKGSDRLWELEELSGAGLRETRKRLNAAGLSIACMDTSCFFHFQDEGLWRASLEMGKRMVELAAEVSAPGIRIFGDRVQAGADITSTAAWIAEGLQRLAEFARPAGVEVWLESHGDFARAETTLSVLRAADARNAGVVWDPMNAYAEWDEDCADGLRTLGDHVRHVHIKDGLRRGGARQEPWEPVLVGDGDFPAAQLIALLGEHGYARFVSFEWEKKWHPQIPDAEIALPRFMQWIRAELHA